MHSSTQGCTANKNDMETHPKNSHFKTASNSFQSKTWQKCGNTIPTRSRPTTPLVLRKLSSVQSWNISPDKLCSDVLDEVPMLKTGKQHVEIFCFHKTTYIASFLFSDSYFRAAQIAKISLLALIVASLNNNLVLHARCNCRLLFFIVVWCIARQVDRNGETVKHFRYNCIEVFLQFRITYCTNPRQYS